MIITKTPFRVSLFGGGSDHPKWFQKHGGKALSIAINKYCYLTTRILPPFFEHDYRIAYSIVETEKSFEDIKHPVVREVIRKYAPNLKLEVHHDGDLPARSGVGSSAAFAVGMIHSILELQNQKPTQTELANLAIEMEYEILKENVGWQDQIACAVGGMNLINFNTNSNWSATKCRLRDETRFEIEDRMALVYSGVNRISSDVTAGLLKNLESKEKLLIRLMELTDSAHSLVEKNGDLDLLGEMLDESWQLKKASNSLANNEKLDRLYVEAKKAGALGGKVLGAGGGGFALFWLPRNGREDFLNRFTFGTVVPIQICDEGSTLLHKSV